MKFTTVLVALVATALAAPIADPVAEPLPAAVPEALPAGVPEPRSEPTIELEKRQSVGSTANEFTRFGCRDVLFFWARGSTEIGNMGSVIGPPLANRLKSIFGSTNVGVEGVDYAALLSTNFLPGGADPAGIAEMRSLLNDAASRCPNSAIVAGGYSQGAALVHRAIENLSATVKARIDGVVTFGDTQNLQDRGQIPNFPREKVRIFCAFGDLVCAGTLTITAAHLGYGSDAPAAAAFLAERIRA